MADEWTLTKELHDLLYQKFLREKSREARKQFDELRLGSLPEDPELTHDEQVHAAGFAKGFRDLCDYLGLDLEGEDE